MIQNIQFPEGTNIKYQRGSYYDQYYKDISISFTPVDGEGVYQNSVLFSARELNLPYQYCFKSAKCIYKLTNPNNLTYTFYTGNCYYDVILDKSSAIICDNAFSNANTNAFMTISLNVSGSPQNFMSYTDVKYLTWDIDTSLWNSNYVFGDSLIALYGNFSMKNYTNVTYYSLTGFTKAKIRQFTITDLGTKSNFTSADFSYWESWGINNPAIPDARKSLIDSLITYSFDRATAGYSTCTIKLAPKTKALLTEEEIAQITAKGYTIS